MGHLAPGELVYRSALTVKGMIAEGRLADAVAMLFYMHKNHILEWVQVKRELLTIAQDSKSLQTLATVLDASKKNSLSESARTIPGLADFFHEDPFQDLLD